MESQTAGGASQGKKRRGATTLEMAFCMSLIIVVCIAAVRYIGNSLKASVANSSQKIQGR